MEVFLTTRNECRDVYDAADVCDNKRGMRLYVDEEDEEQIYCDCMEGWFSNNGNCYQEFTTEPDICPKPGYLLRLEAPKLGQEKVLWPGEQENYKLMWKLNISCMKNPCDQSSTPNL